MFSFVRTDVELAIVDDLSMILVSSSPIVKFCYFNNAVRIFTITFAKFIERCSLRWHFRCEWDQRSIGYLRAIGPTMPL